MSNQSKILDILSQATPVSEEKEDRSMVNVKGHGNIIVIGSSGISLFLIVLLSYLFFK